MTGIDSRPGQQRRRPEIRKMRFHYVDYSTTHKRRRGLTTVSATVPCGTYGEKVRSGAYVSPFFNFIQRFQLGGTSCHDHRIVALCQNSLCNPKAMPLEEPVINHVFSISVTSKAQIIQPFPDGLALIFVDVHSVHRIDPREALHEG